MIRGRKKEREDEKFNEGHTLLYANEIERVRQRQGPSSTTNGGWGREKNNLFTFFEEKPGILGERARTQSPTTTNYAPEFPTFGEIAGVSPT